MGKYIPLRRRTWQPTPVFLPGESQGRGSLVGCRLWGRTESDTTEATQQQQQQQHIPLLFLQIFPLLLNQQRSKVKMSKGENIADMKDSQKQAYQNSNHKDPLSPGHYPCVCVSARTHTHLLLTNSSLSTTLKSHRSLGWFSLGNNSQHAIHKLGSSVSCVGNIVLAKMKLHNLDNLVATTEILYHSDQGSDTAGVASVFYQLHSGCWKHQPSFWSKKSATQLTWKALWPNLSITTAGLITNRRKLIFFFPVEPRKWVKRLHFHQAVSG